MNIDDEVAALITTAIGRAMLELRLAGLSADEYSIAQKLEEYKREEKNVIGKAVYRNTAELVRSSSAVVK